MARIVRGPTSWKMTRDSEGHREYKVVWTVATSQDEGPARALSAPGLPVYGSKWRVGNDRDQWAWCRWDASVTPKMTGEPNIQFDVEFTFGTKPPDSKACKDVQVEDPLLEPAKISGSFTRYSEEATRDRFGNPLVNSAFEQIRGPQVEFDSNRPSVKIEQNVAKLNLALCASMVDTLNASPMWGLARRRIKLGNLSWERKFQGACEVYYTRTLEFEVRYDGFDRDILDEGTKCLNGRWKPETGHWELLPMGSPPGNPDPDPRNPLHYTRYKDKNGENTKVILDGLGRPYDPSLVEVPAWWAVTVAGDTSCKFLTCTSAQVLVGPKGVMQGPYKDEAECVQDDTLWLADPCTGFSRPGKLHVEKYGESEFLLLGVPLVF